MTRIKRSFTDEERLNFLQEAEREGVSVTCRKHNLAPNMIHTWRKRYLAKGLEGLKPSYRRKDPQVKALEEDVERLKRIIIKQAMELEVKTEMLKKTPIQFKKSGK